MLSVFLKQPLVPGEPDSVLEVCVGVVKQVSPPLEDPREMTKLVTAGCARCRVMVGERSLVKQVVFE